MILKIIVTGWGVLIAALLINALEIKLGITNWYQFIDLISKYGFPKVFQKVSPLSLLFLFLIYPSLLGAAAYFILKLFK